MYLPVFQSIPDDWLGRWRLIRRFASKVCSVKLPDVGRVPDRVPEIEAQLDGRRLSPSIVEWVAFIEDLCAKSPGAKSDLTRPGNHQTKNHPEYAANLSHWPANPFDHSCISLGAESADSLGPARRHNLVKQMTLC